MVEVYKMPKNLKVHEDEGEEEEVVDEIFWDERYWFLMWPGMIHFMTSE